MLGIGDADQGVEARIWEYGFSCMLNIAYPLACCTSISSLAAIARCCDSCRFGYCASLPIRRLKLGLAILLLSLCRFSSLCLH